jgi:uncharacterized protein (UPF0371 family)
MVAFDQEKYLKLQTDAIISRLRYFTKGKLYFEIGGKFLYDEHAERVIPGFDPLAKVKIIEKLGKDFDIILCINSKEIEAGRIWKPGTDYEHTLLNLLTNIKLFKLPKPFIAVNLYQNQEKTNKIINRLQYHDYKVYKRYEIPDYPNNLDLIISEDGFGKDEYIPVKHKLVLVISLGSNSGKLSTSFGQIYHEAKMKQDSGFAKFELFPVWNLSLEHPINLAYEAATADIGDHNQIDEYHRTAHHVLATNYNRDVQSFPIMRALIERVSSPHNQMRAFKSPTAIGINKLKDAITNMKEVNLACIQEIKQRIVSYRASKSPDSQAWVATCMRLLNRAEAYVANHSH